jgi:hypothetical protein
MSTVTRVNFEPVRDVLPVQRADFPLAVPSLADPLNAVVLVDGEWMALNSSYQIVRATDVTTPGAEATARSYPLWAERGRSDVLAQGNRKMPVLWMGHWEFNTRIFDAAAAVGTGSAITAVDQPLKVATITIGGRNYTGLVGSDTNDPGAIVVGYVTRLPANNGGKLRLRGGLY